MKSSSAVKICGITRAQDFVSCAQHGVDFVGINLIPSSPRFLSFESFQKLIAELEMDLTKLPKKLPNFVFVTTLELIEDAGDQFRATLGLCNRLGVRPYGMQFHGEEAIEDVRKLKKNLPPGLSLWKAVRVDDNFSADLIERWVTEVELLLFDGSKPGTGTRFDLRSIDAVRGILQIPWGIAGGVSGKNFLEFSRLNPSLIDICSGVESSPGMKNDSLIKTIMGLT